MREVRSELSIARYLAMPPDMSLEPGELPEKMSDFELNYLLDHTNKELGCLILGSIPSDEFRPALDIEHELVKRGAAQLETTIRSAILRALGILPSSLVIRKEKGVCLTPFGLVAKSLAGHQLHYLSPLAPLADIYGNTHSKDHKLQETLPHLRRVALLSTIAKTKHKPISQSALSAEMQVKLGFPKRFTAHYIEGFHAARLLEVEKDESFGSKGRNYITPKPVIKKLGRELLTMTTGMFNRDQDYLDDGNAKLKKVLDDTAAIPYLVRRSILSTGRPKTNTAALAERVKELIEENGSAMTSKEIFAAIDNDIRSRYVDIKSFRSVLAATTALPDQPLLPLRDGHQLIWTVRRR